MAKIVLAMATTHGPQLHTTAEQWSLRVAADKARSHPFRGREYSFDELVELRRCEGLAEKSSLEAMKEYHRRCHAAMDALAERWREVDADIAVLLGNDQTEIYETDTLNPAFMVYYGDKIPHYPANAEWRKRMGPGTAEAELGHAMSSYTEYPGCPQLARHIIETLVANDFDVATSKVWPSQARNGAPHAFGHIYRQVMRDKVVPHVPVFQNTFYPPNQPSARRAFAFGQSVAQAIETWPSDKRVALFASGGMSHFVIDEAFDTRFIGALKARDNDYLTSIPLCELQSGNSELKSWISLAGALEGCDARLHQLDYVPCYRSAAGTGTANGFFWWDVKGRR